MYSILILAVSSLLFASNTLAAPLEVRDSAATCGPHDFSGVKRVSISTDATGKYSWILQNDENGRTFSEVVVSFVFLLLLPPSPPSQTQRPE
jgi:hypothetical protein